MSSPNLVNIVVTREEGNNDNLVKKVVEFLGEDAHLVRFLEVPSIQFEKLDVTNDNKTSPGEIISDIDCVCLTSPEAAKRFVEVFAGVKCSYKNQVKIAVVGDATGNAYLQALKKALKSRMSFLKSRSGSSGSGLHEASENAVPDPNGSPSAWKSILPSVIFFTSPMSDGVSLGKFLPVDGDIPPGVSSPSQELKPLDVNPTHERLPASSRILLPGSALQKDELKSTLEGRGCQVQKLATYTTCSVKKPVVTVLHRNVGSFCPSEIFGTSVREDAKCEKNNPHQKCEIEGPIPPNTNSTIWTFASPSAVKTVLTEWGVHVECGVCIGKTSAKALKQHNKKARIRCPENPGCNPWAALVVEEVRTMIPGIQAPEISISN